MMLSKNSKHISLIPGLVTLVIMLVFALPALAQKPTIVAKLDSATLLMGRTGTLTLEVEKPATSHGHLPLFETRTGEPYVALCGDSVELLRNFTTDTVRNGALEKISFHIPVQAFDSGTYLIPGFQFVADQDTLLSNSVTLNVVPVKVAADAEITPMTDVENPEDGSWTDKLPDWLYNYWWAIVIGLVIIVVGLIVYFKCFHGKKRTKAKKENPLSLYDRTMRQLQELKAKELWQNGQGKEYFSELTDILRGYIAKRFGVAAPEMTTEQFLQEAQSEPKLAGHEQELQRLLELADFVKFAKGQTLPAENQEAFTIVSSFVQSTKYTPEEIQAIKEAQQRKEGAK